MHKNKIENVAVIIVIGMIISAFILSKFFLNVSYEKNITVKGFAHIEMKSDIGKLRFSIACQRNTLQESYRQIKKDKKIVTDYLMAKGFTVDKIENTGLYTYDIKEINSKGMYTNTIEGYNATQNMMITSSDVDLIKIMSEELTSIIESGVNISVNEPQYYISDLQDLKIELLVKATRDGFSRAKKLAIESDANVGSLVSANQGVFQITEPNSMETSSYGIYNTSSITKSVKAVVTLSYAVK